MKLLHLADLHIGKRVNEFSMIEDQKYILIKILNIIDDEQPDAILIAGDVYDKAVPSAEAVEVLDKFINDLAKRRVETFIISGNHDSAERMAFASRLIDTAGIHISPVYNGEVKPRVLADDFGDVNIYMLPFIKPINVKAAFGIEDTLSYNDAVEMAILKMNIDPTCRNVILSHQFVTGASVCDSEELSVGGTDGVSARVYEAFDYAALGHLHGPQKALKDTIRYSGTPLKYSFSEANHHKSVTIIEMAEKGNINIRQIPLEPKRDMVEIKGFYNDLMEKSFYSKLNLENYFHITLVDENDVADAITRLRNVYKNIMKLDYDNKRTQSRSKMSAVDEVEKKQPIELVNELYQIQNNAEMSMDQMEYVAAVIEKIGEGQECDQ